MKKLIALLCMFMLLITAFSGCGNNNEEAKPSDPVSPTESAEQSEAEAKTGRQDGERFETTIVIEGMEETVKYEHVRNETAGFEMDFDYESYVRRSESDRECFVSSYDDPKDFQNYLEVAYSAEDADTVTAAVSKVLSKDYDVIRETVTLDGAGACLRIEASGGRENAAALQTVYVIPAPDGCLVAAAHCTFESAEGFGARFAELVNTLTVIAG
jgi:hypothetical protein